MDNVDVYSKNQISVRRTPQREELKKTKITNEIERG